MRVATKTLSPIAECMCRDFENLPVIFCSPCAYIGCMDIDLTKTSEKNLRTAAEIEENTTSIIHQREQSLQNKKIALLSFLAATVFGWLGFALAPGELNTLQWSALLVLLIGGFGPGLIAIFSPTAEDEPRLEPEAVAFPSKELAALRWRLARDASIQADNRLKRDAKRFWRWVLIAMPATILSILLFTVGAVTKGDTSGKVQSQEISSDISQEVSA